MWRSYLYSSVYSCHLFLISSASVRSLPFLILYFAHLCMKYSFGISNFLEEISSLFSFYCFLLFLCTVIGGRLSNLSLLFFGNLHSNGYIFPFLLFFGFSSFHSYIRPPQTTILPFCISFSWGWCWSLPPVQCHEPPSNSSSGTLSALIPWIYLSLPLYNHKGFDLGHYWNSVVSCWGQHNMGSVTGTTTSLRMQKFAQSNIV